MCRSHRRYRNFEPQQGCADKFLSNEVSVTQSRSRKDGTQAKGLQVDGFETGDGPLIK
jgi:hypothetical protein